MRPSILIVDDNAANLRSMEALLGDVGAELDLVSSGQQALKRVLAKDYALILLDVQMPDMDGYETARIIRTRDRSNRTPIIFVTAFSRSDEHVLKAYALGAVDFLSKPVQPEILRGKVSVFLELHKMTLEVRAHEAELRAIREREHARELERERQRLERATLESQRELERQHAATLERRSERLRALSDVAGDLLRAESEAEVIQVFEQASRSIFRIDVPLLWRRDGAGRIRKVADDGSAAKVAPEDGTFEQIAGPARVVRPQEVPWLEENGFSSALVRSVPSQRAGSFVAIGAMLADRTFDPSECSLFAILSEQVVLAFERTSLVRELREADRRKDEFIAMLGHELRNPLAPIRTALDFLRQNQLEPSTQRLLDAAVRQERHMARLLDDLLDVSRITQGRISLRRRTFALDELIETSVNAVQPLFDQKRLKLVRDVPGQRVWLDADSSRLTQVLANLLNNAAKFSEAGQTITLAARAQGARLTVRIRDQGAGIRPEMLESIFQAFVQDSTTLHRSGAGLGLGLAVARKLVELHGGTLVAHSDGQGTGSEFVLTAPVVTEVSGEEKAAPPKQQRAVETSQRSVALVEDNPDIRESMVSLLELRGFQVFSAEDGEEGARTILQHHPDIALVDIGLPGMDGFAVARRVRSEEGDAHTALVALTGYGTESDREAAREAGFDAHLTKPVGLDELEALFARLAGDS